MASIERSLWRPLCLHSATTATLEPLWRWFCLHSAFFARPVVPLQQLWSFKEGTRVVLQQLHRNRTFWVPATTERPNHFYGRTRVARRSQPCVKGPLVPWFPPTPQPSTLHPVEVRCFVQILFVSVCDVWLFLPDHIRLNCRRLLGLKNQGSPPYVSSVCKALIKLYFNSYVFILPSNLNTFL